MMKIAMIAALLATALLCPAQPPAKFWVYFADKGCAGVGDFLDRSVCPAYLDSLECLGFPPVVASRWLNAATVSATAQQAAQLARLGFVRQTARAHSLSRSARHRQASFEPARYTKVLRQVNAQAIAAQGWDGKGVKIGIVDGGFLNAQHSPLLRHVLDEGRLKAYKNFTDPSQDDPFAGRRALMDHHGTQVWELVAGYDPEAKTQKGLAPAAEFYLAKTDQGDREFRGEEGYWVAALEWLDSLGVRLVNSSVGYSIGYDDPAENYTREMVDGKSAAITRAAKIAVEKKKMVIVASAGNDGKGDFEVLSVPSDAKGLVTVGATAHPSWTKMGYSSIGPEVLGYPKPDIACYSVLGTSFSAPVITGLAACILQARPGIAPHTLKTLLTKASHLYPYANNYLGYGVPDGEKLAALLDGDRLPGRWRQARGKDDRARVASDGAKQAVVFHKKDKLVVVKQQTLKASLGYFMVERPLGAKYSTVAFGGQVVEVKW